MKYNSFEDFCSLLIILLFLLFAFGVCSKAEDNTPYYHIAATTAIGSTVGSMLRQAGADKDEAAIAAFIAPMLVATFKEFVYDKKPDMRDMAGNFIGSTLGACIVFNF